MLMSLIAFSSSYLVEAGYGAVNHILTKKINAQKILKKNSSYAKKNRA